jgi:hypothetical protein
LFALIRWLNLAINLFDFGFLKSPFAKIEKAEQDGSLKIMFTTTTPKDTEGFNVSYSAEESCAKSLAKVLPANWKIHFDWAQILFSDVQYRIDRKTKTVFVVYNQNLHIWWKDLISEIEQKLKQKPPRQR